MHAGHFLFTELLMPALFAGAQSSPDHHARVITTSSSAAMLGHIDFASIRDGPARKRRSKEALYGQSKLVSCVSCRLLGWSETRGLGKRHRSP